MITFLDLIQQATFRDYVCHRLAEHTNDGCYSFHTSFPPLYKYRGLSKYAVNDIIQSKITLTPIGDFNDIFDGAMHKYGTEEDRIKAAEQTWAELEKHRVTARLSNGLYNHDDTVNYYKNHYRTESKLTFRELDYIGTYVGSLSTVNSSTLMWSHYAKENSGICIEYDFNQLPPTYILRDMIFPVSYSDKPIELTDLLEDINHNVYQYPLDAAVLCAALSKANIWNYEHEWRIVLVNALGNRERHRMPINTFMLPRSICFGYHFLKPMFYCNYNNTGERDVAAKRIERLVKLISYMVDHKIGAKIMVPVIGTYELKAVPVEIEELKKFITYQFRGQKPECIRFYYTIHDELMDIVEGK